MIASASCSPPLEKWAHTSGEVGTERGPWSGEHDCCISPHSSNSYRPPGASNASAFRRKPNRCRLCGSHFSNTRTSACAVSAPRLISTQQALPQQIRKACLREAARTRARASPALSTPQQPVPLTLLPVREQLPGVVSVAHEVCLLCRSVVKSTHGASLTGNNCSRRSSP